MTPENWKFLREAPELTGEEELSNGNVQYACTIDVLIGPEEGGQITYETSGQNGDRKWYAMFVHADGMHEAPHDLPVPPALEQLLHRELQTRPVLFPESGDDA